MGKEGSITIKEVAKKAGVSVATAGRAMGNYGRISEETRQRVLKAAEELDYVPNKLAQSMRSRSTKTIAVVVPDIQNNFFGAIVAAMEQRAREKGYAILICNTNEKRELELDCLEMLASKQVDGILLASTFVDKSEIPGRYVKSIFYKFPFVLFDRKINDFPFVSILSDNYNMAYRVTKYIIGLGHTDIATIGSEKEHVVSNTVKEREAGYRAALREAGLGHDGLSINVDWKEQRETEKRLNILLDYHKVSAIIVFNNSIIGELLNILNKRKLIIPDNISIATWDDEEYDEFLKITAVKQPCKKMGELAVDSLIERIEADDDRMEELTITLNSTLIQRESCKIYRA
ncbi:MAG: LacI family DNA-binding transcriptional regulator [Lachnospiraceae bacterium]|nr:LacI family DNA-binding transcriptional regulator [Lachnospiraceae bacterium]